MIESGLTLASLAGALAYLATALVALVAAQGRWQRNAVAAWRWRLVAGLFLALAGWRLGLGEIRFQDDVRAWMRNHGLYEERHTLQALLTLAMLAVAGIAAFWLSTWNLTRSLLASLAASGLVLFSAARLVSLHQLDSLLFRLGPLHLNYVIDMGLTAAAAVLAWMEIRASTATARVDPRKASGRRSRS